MNYHKLQELACDVLDFIKLDLEITDIDYIKELVYKLVDIVELSNLSDCEFYEEEE